MHKVLRESVQRLCEQTVIYVPRLITDLFCFHVSFLRHRESYKYKTVVYKSLKTSMNAYLTTKNHHTNPMIEHVAGCIALLMLTDIKYVSTTKYIFEVWANLDINK